MRKILGLVMALALMTVLAVSVSAQDATATPTADGMATVVPATLEEVTSNRTAFDAQSVIMEGFIETFLSVDAFILGENVSIDNDQVLVINNTGRSLPRDLFTGANIVITGVVRPSYDDVASGSMTVDVMPMDVAMQTELALLNEANMGATSYGMYYTGLFPSDYFGYTIIELTDVTTLAFLPTE